MIKIQIIEDDPDLGMILQRFFTKKGFDVHLEINGKSGVAYFQSNKPDVLITDFKLGDIDGSEIVLEFRKLYPKTPAIVMTGYADIQTAVHVMKSGANDYVTKPIIPADMIQRIDDLLKNQNEHTDIDTFSKSENTGQAIKSTKATKKSKHSYILGKSDASVQLYKMIDLVAPTDFSVIIYGESGVGKESVANMIHEKSDRAEFPFVAIDCGALPKDLANSELFGYEKGAFTGALHAKPGLFEVANGGTIFLDEVANLPYDVQVSLLRIVQERKLKRIGSTKDISIDVRIIVASNEQLKSAADAGKFREDLYHRFNEFSITVPPLRQRGIDILLMAEAFLKQTSEQLNKEINGFSGEVERVFLNYPWYGNVRELKNVIKRSTLLNDGLYIELSSLPVEMTNPQSTNGENIKNSEFDHHKISATQDTNAVHDSNIVPQQTDLKTLTHNTEYTMIMNAIKQANFNKLKAAKLLNIDRKTLYNKLKYYNIK